MPIHAVRPGTTSSRSSGTPHRGNLAIWAAAILAALLGTAVATQAEIVAGPAIIPVPSCAGPGCSIALTQQGFNEVQDLALPVDVEVDPGGAVIPAGTLVDSHMIFLDTNGVTTSTVSAWVFDGIIVGVMSDTDGALEDMSNPILGVTTYPGSFAFRGLEPSLGDGYSIITANTIEVTMNVTSPGDWIRVVTCPFESCIDFQDLPIGMVYPCPSSFMSHGYNIKVKPLTCGTSCGFAAVDTAGVAGGMGNEMNLNNVDLEFETGGVKRVTLKFGELGGQNSFSINGVALPPCPMACFDDLNIPAFFTVLGDNFDVNVTFAGAACTATGEIEIVALTGCIDTFAIGGQELFIDDVCLCDPCGPVPPACPADLDGNGEVSGADLGMLLGAWGGPYVPCPPYLPQDLDQNCVIDGADLGIMLASWGPCR